MVKPLFPHGKANETGIAQVRDSKPLNAPVSDKTQAAQANAPQTPPVELSQESWDKSLHDPKNVPWMNDSKSRLAVRTFSRGVLGAAAFAAGGLYEKNMMRKYDANIPYKDLVKNNGFTFLARSIDTMVGRPIKAIVTAVAGAEAGEKSVLFRPTYYPSQGTTSDNPHRWGRSLGHEVVDVTFDFFCASVADAFGRDLVGLFDPNVKKTWIKDDGSINITDAAHHAVKAVTRYVTYNGGEDWAVSLPYVYFMKGQRSLIDKISPGFKYDFDYGKNGSSFKVGGHPRLPNNLPDPNYKTPITGSYALEGIADLQSRFTVYNIGTLMYREMYDHVGNIMHGRPDNLYGDPTKQTHPKTLSEKTGDLLKWTARSIVKGTIIMTPSVPFFSLTRATQLKHKGLFIHPDEGMLTRSKNDGTGQLTPLDSESKDAKHRQALLEYPTHFSRYDNKVLQTNKVPFSHLGPMNPALTNPSAKDRNIAGLGGTFHPYEMGNGVERAFDKIGHIQYEASNLLKVPADVVDHISGGRGIKFKEALGFEIEMGKPGDMQSFTRLTQPYARAAMSYTPYMYAKAEFANLWDNGKTDMAAERMIDGATKLNWKEFKAGTGEVWNAILHKPMADPMREVEAQRRIQADNSQPENMTVEQFQTQQQQEHNKFKHDEHKVLQVKKFESERRNAGLSWQDRVVSGRSEEQLAADNKQKKASFSEQEAMRKALEQLSPPTNAIN